MAESFSDIGKMEAIEQLYRLSAYSPVSGLSYTSAKGGKVIVKSINNDIRQVFMITGFLNLFEIED